MKDSNRVGIAVVFAILLFSLSVAYADEIASASNNITSMNISSNLSSAKLSISGIVFNDLNGDGLRTKDELGLPGWTIILSLNGKNISQNITNNAGRFSFENLLPGRYIVMEEKTKGWNQTCPGGGSYDISLADKDALNYDFGNHYGLVKYGLVGVVKHPIMSKNAWLIHAQGVKKSFESKVSSQPANLTKPQENFSYPESFSLLSYVPYVSKERDQGSCGDCWVWGCTAPIEVAHYIQNGVNDRLSIQYLNSNYNGGSGPNWACCGGWEGGFADFYTAQGIFIPWSNANANFQDGTQHCSDSTMVPASSISTTPNYPITSIKWNPIITRGSGITQDQAINNIKAILNMNEAVTLGFYLPDFTPFWSFWSSSSSIWNPDPRCGLPDGQYPGGHEVTIVGYVDTNSSNRYWIALNSWGANSAHPDGTFKLKMDMNYNCMNPGNTGYYSYDFGYFDVTFSPGGNNCMGTCVANCVKDCPKQPGMQRNLCIGRCLGYCDNICP